jgi:hypothetical protein
MKIRYEINVLHVYKLGSTDVSISMVQDDQFSYTDVAIM